MNEKEYLNSLKNKFIEYRYDLNFDDYITFGIEIEYENIVKDSLSCYMSELEIMSDDYRDWKNTNEIDIQEYKDNEIMNGEVKSPVLRNRIQDWKNLKTTVNLIDYYGGVVTNSCGGHINIGSQILGNNPENWRNLFLLWILYEKEIYKFSSGEFKRIRKAKDATINRVALYLIENLKTILEKNSTAFPYIKNISDALFDKKHDLSLNKVTSYSIKKDNVIEFRLPNGTLREEIWQNYINFFVKFLLSCKKELDLEKTLYQIKNNEHSAISLANYVFDDEIDKQNFLIQTLKLNKSYNRDLVPHIHY